MLADIRERARSELVCDGGDHINQPRYGVERGLFEGRYVRMADMLDEALDGLNRAANELTDGAFTLKEGAAAGANENAATAGGGTRFSSPLNLPDERADAAREMLDKGAANSEVYNKTGIVVQADGRLRDGFDGEIIGRYDRGGNDQGRVDGESKPKQLTERKAGRRLEAGARAPRGARRPEWGGLSSNKRKRITSALERRMADASSEGKAFYELFGSPEAFAEEFYTRLQQDPVVAEQWSDFIPDIDGLMDEIEAVAEENGKSDYSFMLPRLREELDRMIEEYGAIPAGERPFREIELPRRTSENEKVSQTARTILEAEAPVKLKYSEEMNTRRAGRSSGYLLCNGPQGVPHCCR